MSNFWIGVNLKIISDIWLSFPNASLLRLESIVTLDKTLFGSSTVTDGFPSRTCSQMISTSGDSTIDPDTIFFLDQT